MRIRRLRLSGFKSFVEPAELRIEPGLTGVVGPNGCGKSNLLEAIRWVMGESSPKSMRGGGMDDVIFAGTSTRPARDFAEVALVADLDGSAPASLADLGHDDELEVVRRIERGAGSAWRANGRDVRAKDVALIFADAATGAHSPALVSQGKIAAVIAAKPSDRRQMLEEAAGISGLHVRRRDAEQKLRATEANLSRLDDMLTDMEQRGGALKRQARAAERYTKLSDEMRLAEGRMIYARWRDAAAAADIARVEAESAATAVSNAQQAQEAAAAWHGQAVQALASSRAADQAAFEALNTVAQALLRESSEAETTARRLADRREQLDRLIDDTEREGTLASDAATAIVNLAEERGALTDRIASIERDRSALVDGVNTSAGILRDAEIMLAQARADAANELADRRIAIAAEDSARREAAGVDRRVEALRGDRAKLGTQASIEQTVAVADAAAGTRQSAVHEAEAGVERARDARNGAQDRLELANIGLGEARAALAALESERTALSRAAAHNELKNNRAIDAISVASGYEIAMAAALGDELDAAIGNEGLRAWRGASGKGDEALPAGIEPLARFVTAPPQLSRRLAQIGVVDSDTGVALLPGQRIVTRDGRLRRWDGFVSSGDGAAAADALLRTNRIGAIEAELPSLRQAVDAAATNTQAVFTEAGQATASAEAARATLDQTDRDYRTALTEQSRAQAALDAHNTSAMQIDEGLTDLADLLANAQGALDQASQRLAELPDSAATDNRLALLDSSAAAARDRAQASDNALRQHERDAGEARERLAGLVAEDKGWRARAGEAAQRVADMTQRKERLGREIAELVDTAPESEKRIADLQAERAALADSSSRANEELRAGDAELAAREARLVETREALSLARETRAGAAARAEAQDFRRIEMGRVSGERFECPPPLLPQVIGFDDADVTDPQAESQRHERLHAERERIGPVNLIAAHELAELEASQTQSRAEAAELHEAVNRLRGSIGSLNREGRTRLLAAFEAVNEHFQRLFTTLFDGGSARLELIDSDDPLEAGLEIMAQPPGKKLASLTLLSGGEQALTAIALIFGLFLTNPAPICVLDEVDAPLDDANIERFCDLLDRMVAETDTRYLIVTHNAVTMSRMHRLFGVTMVEQGVSRLVSVDLMAAEELVAAE